MKDIVIYGAGGFAREVLQVVLDINEVEPRWNVLGFLVDEQYRTVDEIHGFPVLGGAEWIAGSPGICVAVANGTPRHRRQMVERLAAHGQPEYPVLLHPRSWVGRRVSPGPGCIVCANCSLTTDISLGEHVTVNINATIGHDTVVGAFSTLSPGVKLSGNVTVESDVEFGTNAVVVPHVAIGAGSVLGAGAVAVKDVPPGVVAVGVPAKVVG